MILVRIDVIPNIGTLSNYYKYNHYSIDNQMINCYSYTSKLPNNNNYPLHSTGMDRSAIELGSKEVRQCSVVKCTHRINMAPKHCTIQ